MGKNSKWIDNPVLLDSFSSESLDEKNKPGLISSHDQSLIAFTYRQLTKADTTQAFRVIVLDTSLVLKYSKEIIIPVSGQMFVPLEFVLTDSGSFVLLGIHYTTEKKIKAPAVIVIGDVVKQQPNFQKHLVNLNYLETL